MSAVNRGKVIILVVLTAALGVSAYGVWYRHHQMRRVLEAFSPRVAQLIAYAPRAEVLQLGVSESSGSNRSGDEETITLLGATYPIKERKDLAGSRGFSNLRADLVHDSSYAWDEFSDRSIAINPAANWDYILIVVDDSGEAKLAFDMKSCRMMAIDSRRTLSISPICEAAAAFFSEQFSSASKSRTSR